MGREKSIKVDYKGIKITYGDKLKGMLEIVDEETGEFTNADIDLTAEIKDMLKTLTEEDKVSICLKKFKAPVEKEKQPIFKYKCGCGKEIKSKVEGLDITCNECEETFVMES